MACCSRGKARACTTSQSIISARNSSPPASVASGFAPSIGLLHLSLPSSPSPMSCGSRSRNQVRPPKTHRASAAPLCCSSPRVPVLTRVAVTSLCLSRDGRHALVNTMGNEIHLWDLAQPSIVRRFAGHKQGRFVIRAAFGGADESYVVSGSEDSQVYIWHRHSGSLLEVLPGHSGAVNAVCWSPVTCIFASASDDHTVRVWAPP